MHLSLVHQERPTEDPGGAAEGYFKRTGFFAGRLKGNGWTAGAYFGWRVLTGLRFDAGVSRSGIAYDGTAGTAAATFPGSRWSPRRR